MNHKDNISSQRKDYQAGKLVMSELKDHPVEQFKLWLNEAMATSTPEPTAMNLATCCPRQGLSSRMVLLKGVDAGGFVFYTNYDSRKAQDLSAFASAALCFWWGILERQVRVEGRVERVSQQESDAYFQSRPRGSQIGAIASRQSAVIDGYKQLRRQVETLASKYQDFTVIPRPECWGGYRVIPHAIEFWQGRPNRLHDRLRYKKQAQGGWLIERLSP